MKSRVSSLSSLREKETQQQRELINKTELAEFYS